MEQTYDNYEVLYVNDASTDNTWELVNKIVGKNKKFNLINNETNMGATYNYNDYFDKLNLKDDDILVHLDGDDWFASPDVLEKLNKLYVEKTYG